MLVKRVVKSISNNKVYQIALEIILNALQNYVAADIINNTLNVLLS